MSSREADWSQSPAETLSTVEESLPGLTFADGFQFGCGFMLAVTLSVMILLLAILVLLLLLPLLGIHLFS